MLELTLRLYKLTSRPQFKQWIELEEKKGQVIRAVEEGSPDFPSLLASFLSTALHVPAHLFKLVPWWGSIRAFNEVLIKNNPRIPLPLIVEYDNSPTKEDGWDYKGRLWHLHSHLLAKNYGWKLEYISKLDVEEALAKIQEILTDIQLEREFIWSTSEVAYPYDSQSKSGKFVPLSRPYWMNPKAQLPKKIKILKKLMPVGSVDYEAVGEYAPKDIKH